MKAIVGKLSFNKSNEERSASKYKSSDQSTVSNHIGQRAGNISNVWGEARQSTDQSTVANHRLLDRRFLFLVKKLSTSSR